MKSIPGFYMLLQEKEHPAKCRDPLRYVLFRRLFRLAAKDFPVSIQEHGDLAVHFRYNGCFHVREIEQRKNCLLSVGAGIGKDTLIAALMEKVIFSGILARS